MDLERFDGQSRMDFFGGESLHDLDGRKKRFVGVGEVSLVKVLNTDLIQAMDCSNLRGQRVGIHVDR